MASVAKEKKLHKQSSMQSFGQDDTFNAKSSMKGRSKAPQQTYNNPTQTVVVKSRMPFNSLVEESGLIKERTNKLFLTRFEGKLDDNNKIIPTSLPSNAYHGTRRNSSVNIHFNGVLESLKEGQLTEEDSFVPKSTAVKLSIFPAGEKKIFPERRPHTGCWKLGLRQYEQTRKQAAESEAISGATSNTDLSVEQGLDTVSVGSVESTKSIKRPTGGTKAAGKLRRQASDDSFNMRQTNSVKQMNSYLHAQYASTDLPKLTKDQNKNYFGPSGTENFFKTYKELKHRGEVLLDGYAALEELVLLPEEDNMLLNSIKSLENLGVLTPRDPTITQVDDPSLHNDDSSLGSEHGHFTPFTHSPKSPQGGSTKGFVPDLLAQRVMSFNKLAHDPNVAAAVTLFAAHGKASASASAAAAEAQALTPAAQAEKERLEKVAAERHRLMNIHAPSGTQPTEPITISSAHSVHVEGAGPMHIPTRHASSPELSAHRKNLTHANTLANTNLHLNTTASTNKTSLAGVLKAHKASKNFTSLRSISRLESLPPIHVNNKTIITNNNNSANGSFTSTANGSVHGKGNDFGAGKGRNVQSLGTLPRPGLSRGSTATGRSAISGITASTARPPSPTELGEPVFVHAEEPEKDPFGFDSDSDNDSDIAQRIYASQPFAGGNSKKWSGIDPHKDVAVLDLTPFVRRLDEPLPVDHALESSYSIASPRAIFLAGCLQHNIPPITVALIRKKISSTINLAHMGLGTKVAKVLAPCLQSIPYLQLLNLTDNNLDDEGLSVLLHAVSQHKTIEILDISQNIIGSKAAAALAVMLQDPNYTLQCLRMSNANIDDGECANFVEVLMNNRHLKELDMSNNLLGKDENLNAVQPDFVTGGESLSELLSNPNCPLTTLNLHWNMIRLEGAEVLCNSLRTNRVLTNLDLSYNALGNAAGVLGAALIENNVLVELNVGNNGIDEFGCFTLMVGVRENKSLRSLVLDGNPVGVQGGRILIKVATALGNRLNISAKNCDFNIHNSNFKFNINEPYGEFTLDLAVPYERAVVLEILNIGQIDTSIEFTKFEYCEQSGTTTNAPFVPMKLVRFEQPVTEFSRAETRELQDLTALSAISAHSWEDLFHTAQRYCTLDPEVLVKSDTEKLLREMKVNDMNTVIGEIFFTLDPMQFGWIDLHEFVGYMIKRSNASKSRIHSMKHDSIFAISTNPTVRYIPPLTGKIRVRTIEGFSCDPDTVAFKPISNSQCRQVLKCADNSSNPLSLIIFAIEATRLHIEEAKLMYKQVMSKTEDSIMAIAVILQHMRSTDDALRVLKQFIGTDILRWRRLKQRLGSTLLPLIGIYSGFYHLDLSYPADRVCLKKLIERSVKNCDYRMKNKLGDTSQHGNWTCFRNEHHLERPEERICPKYYYPMPEKAKLDFDFINIDRPDVTLHRAVGEDSIIDLLLMCRLLDEHLVDWALARLKELGASARKSVLSNGKPVWKSEVGRAVAVNDTVYSFYNNLSSRQKSYIKSQKRETMTKSAPTSTTNSSSTGARKGKAGHHGDDHHGHHKTGVKRTSMVERDRMREEKEKQAKLLAAANKNLDIVTFRSFNLKGKQHQMKAFWSKRLFEVMYESNGTDEMKSAAIIEFLEIMMSTWWVYCRHLSLILELFTIGSVAKSSMGSYRVELIVMWFDHILDIQNFEQVLMVLNAEEQAAVHSRIGILNIFNPCKPEGGWQLDLMRWEERQVAKMLIHLSVVEPGDNWFEPVFIFDHGFQPAPGWSLSVVWLTEAGLPFKGVLTLEFFSGGGANMQNCLVDRRLRALLCTLTLVAKRDLPLEFKINKQENFAVGLERKDSFDPNNPLLANLVGAALKAATSGSGEKSSAPAAAAVSQAALSGTSTPGTEQLERGERAGHHSHHHNTDTHSETDTAHAANHLQLQAFARPQAVSQYTALRTQIQLMPQLYYDDKQKKLVTEYTYRDCNAHLKTCNVEWTYADADNFKVDPWRL